MVFGNVKHLEEFSFLDSSVRECLDYFNSHDLASYEKGSHEIDGKRLFVNIVEYQTVEAEKRFCRNEKGRFSRMLSERWTPHGGSGGWAGGYKEGDF